jgi:hypothetical protein
MSATEPIGLAPAAQAPSVRPLSLSMDIGPVENAPKKRGVRKLPCSLKSPQWLSNGEGGSHPHRCLDPMTRAEQTGLNSRV